MDSTAPLELNALLHAADATHREAAWDSLIASHSRLILAAAHDLGGGSDAVMDRYAYVLEKLREHDYRRLRAFRTDGRAKFSTWLTIAARRLCLDHYRAQYGRTRTDEDDNAVLARRRFRRQLQDSLGVSLTTQNIARDDDAPLDHDLLLTERDRALSDVLATLPASDRLLLAYRFEDNLTAAQIAPLIHVPTPFHVFRRINRILAELRLALETRGISHSDG